METEVQENFAITKEAPTRAFSWFKATTSACLEALLHLQISVIVNSSGTFVSSSTAGGRGDGVQENRIFSEYPRVQSKSS